MKVEDVLTNSDIQEKVDWLCEQYEKNKELLSTYEGDKGELAKEMLDRVGEVLAEYKRLAACIIEERREMRELVRTVLLSDGESPENKHDERKKS